MPARIIGINAIALFLAGCSAPVESEQLDSMKLTAGEKAIAQAMIAGMKANSAFPMLRSRDIGQAGCYAKMVDMPAHLDEAHRAYLADFAEADKDYYGFFARYGIDEESAYSVFERYEAAVEKCSMSGLIKGVTGE